MVKTTREQRKVLKRVYDRRPMFHEEVVNHVPLLLRTTYREFRKTLHRGPDCVMIQWSGMWLGIEPDGYTHS